MIIFFALSVLLPLGLAMLIAFRYWQNGWVLLSLIAFTLFGTVYAGFNAPWFLYSYWLLLGLSVVVVASVLAGLQKLRRVYWYWPSIPVLGFTVLLIVGSVYFAVSGVLAIGATRAPDQVVELEFPLRNGVFAIVQGGSGPPLQGGHASTPSQTYAIDAVRLNNFGTTRTSP